MEERGRRVRDRGEAVIEMGRGENESRCLYLTQARAAYFTVSMSSGSDYTCLHSHLHPNTVDAVCNTHTRFLCRPVRFSDSAAFWV